MGELRAWYDDSVQYAKQARHWKQVQAQIDDARAIFDPLRFSMGLPDGMTLTTVDPGYLVVEACGSKARNLGMEKVFPVLRLKTRNEIEEQQRQICVNIQMMQNRKFNESVRFLEGTLQQAEVALQQIFDARDRGGNTSGSVQSTHSDTSRFGSELDVMAQQWSTRMQAYDAYITAMQARQSVLARAAMRGNPAAEMKADVAGTIALRRALK